MPTIVTVNYVIPDNEEMWKVGEVIEKATRYESPVEFVFVNTAFEVSDDDVETLKYGAERIY